MPTYEYACKSCGHHLEVVQSFSDDALTTCSACAGSLRKVFGNIGISFKGTGFYKNDSRSSARSGSPSASGDSASGDSSSGDSASGDAASGGGSSSGSSSSESTAPAKEAASSKDSPSSRKESAPAKESRTASKPVPSKPAAAAS